MAETIAIHHVTLFLMFVEIILSILAKNVMMVIHKMMMVVLPHVLQKLLATVVMER